MLLKNELKKIDDHAWRAFPYWFAMQKFGVPKKDIEVVDGPYDKSIDALVTFTKNKKTTYAFIQTKYHDRFAENSGRKITSTERDWYAGFVKTKQEFEASDSRFQSWIQTITAVQGSTARAKAAQRAEWLQDIRQKIGDPKELEWHFVTTHKPCNAYEEFKLNKIEFSHAEEIEVLLFGQHQLQHPIVDNLSLTIHHYLPLGEIVNGLESHLGTIQLRDLRDQLRTLEDNDELENLFNRNIRSELTRSHVNKEIRKSLENNSDTFFLKNNGIYIFCRKAIVTKDRYLHSAKVQLVQPQVVNGGQTLRQLSRVPLKKLKENSYILARIVAQERQQSAQDILSDLITATNKQNPVPAWDLRAFDPRILDLSKSCRASKIYVERRSGDWEDQKRRKQHNDLYGKVSLPELAQILVSIKSPESLHEAKKNLEAYFENDTKFRETFNIDLDDAVTATSLYLKTIQASKTYTSKRYKKSQSRAFRYIILSLFFRSIQELEKVERKVVSEWLRGHLLSGPNNDQLKQSMDAILITTTHTVMNCCLKSWSEKRRGSAKDKAPLTIAKFLSQPETFKDLAKPRSKASTSIKTSMRRILKKLADNNYLSRN